MARSQKLEKNLSKVQDMLDGNHNRKLQIGYNRAARIIDMMEANGEVSKANHVGKREVLK